MSDSISEEVICATASALISAGEKVASDLSRGSIGQIYLRGDDGDMVVVKVNDFAELVCMVDRQAKMRITLMEAARCAQKLSEVL
jgi:predicted regulator of Ras-like GTPase activity (Roadblock/LC7/MglB family)